MHGWTDNGEYHCPCGTMFGKNLNGIIPFALVSQHVKTCLPRAVYELKHQDEKGDIWYYDHPSWIEPETWDKAVELYFNSQR